MPPETTCSGKSLLPRHVKCTVRMRALCRDESWAMVPIWAPSAAGTQYYRLFTHSAPRCHATTSVSAYTHRACIFEPLLNSHQECLCVCLAGHASEHRQTKDGSHEQHQCRRNAGDGASCTARGLQQSRRRRSRDGGRWVSRPASMRLSLGMGVDFSCAGAGVCAGVWSWSLCVGGAWCAGARVVTRRVAHGPGACAVLDVAGDLH